MALCIIQVIELLGPHHPAETLAHNILRVSGEVTGNDCGVEFIGSRRRCANMPSKAAKVSSPRRGSRLAAKNNENHGALLGQGAKLHDLSCRCRQREVGAFRDAGTLSSA